jgi:hypothetical protein
MDNYDPLHMLENVSDEELQEFCYKQALKSGQHPRRPLREGFVFLISYFEAIEHIPRRLQFRALMVLLDYAFYGKLPPENTPSRIMQSFVGWKRLLDADAKKYDRRKKDRFAGKTHADNGQETKPQNNKNKTRNKQKVGKK